MMHIFDVFEKRIGKPLKGTFQLCRTWLSMGQTSIALQQRTTLTSSAYQSRLPLPGLHGGEVARLLSFFWTVVQRSTSRAKCMRFNPLFWLHGLTTLRLWTHSSTTRRTFMPAMPIVRRLL